MITVVIANSPGEKFSSSNSYPSLDSISSGNDLIRLKEYSFVKTLNDMAINRMAIIEPLAMGRFVTIDASLFQKFGFMFSKEPTLGIYGQNDLRPKITNNAGSNVNPPSRIKNKAIVNTGAKLRYGSNVAAKSTIIAAIIVVPLKKIGSLTLFTANAIALYLS